MQQTCKWGPLTLEVDKFVAAATRRPVKGFAWRRDLAPVDGGDEHGPWLVPLSEELVPFTAPRGTHLLTRVRRIWDRGEDLIEGVLGLANDYAWLGRPTEVVPARGGKPLEAEPLSLWKSTLAEVADLAGAVADARQLEADGSEVARQSLLSRFGEDGGVVVFRHGERWMRLDPTEATVARGGRIPGHNASLLRLVLHLVNAIATARLQREMSVGVSGFGLHRRSSQPDIGHFPATFRAAMYMQVVYELVGRDGRGGRCLYRSCPDPLRVNERRAGAKFCNPTCRSNERNARHRDTKEAQQ